MQQNNDFFTGLTTDDSLTFTLPFVGTWTIPASPEAIEVLRTMVREIGFNEVVNDLPSFIRIPGMSGTQDATIKRDGVKEQLVCSKILCPLGQKVYNMSVRGEFIPFLALLTALEGVEVRERNRFSLAGEEKTFTWNGSSTVSIVQDGAQYEVPGYGILFWRICQLREEGLVEGTNQDAPFQLTITEGGRTMCFYINEVVRMPISRLEKMAAAGQELSS